MTLQRFDLAWLPELMGWFPGRASCHIWGGVDFRFPFTDATFREDARIESLPTWALVGDHGTFVAFGQYYLRLGRCHLGRLVVAPESRGSGFGGRLVRELCQKGSAELGVDSYSLFVHPDNESALRLYQRLGFSTVPYPEELPAAQHYVYMVASHLK